MVGILPGDVFGERALLNESGRRESTIICTEDAYMLTLSREAFLTFLSDETSKLNIKMCLDVLKKSSKARTEQDIDILLKFTLNCAFLQQLQMEFQKILLREMTFTQYNRHQTVFLQNDESDGFFIILTGNAGVYIRNEVKENHDNNHVVHANFATANDDNNDGMQDIKHSYGEQVAILAPGDAFGERGILKRGTRAATIRAETKLTCMRMSNESYDKILRPLMSDEKSVNTKNGQSISVRFHFLPPT